jgi:hypothetical protein
MAGQMGFAQQNESSHSSCAGELPPDRIFKRRQVQLIDQTIK